MEFAQVLRGYMDKVGCSGKELAAMSGLAPSTVSRYLAGARVPDADSFPASEVARALCTLGEDAGVALDREEVRDALRSAARAAPSPETGRRLATLLDTFGITRAKFAQALGYSASYVSRVCSGTRSPSDLTQFVRDASRFLATEAYLVVAQSLYEYVISLLQHSDLLRRDVAEYAHSQSWSWKWMTGNEMLRHAELSSYASHFVLEQPSQWLAQTEMHLLWQSAHVMVALYHFSRDVERFYSVWIYRSLCQPASVFYLLSLVVEHFYEVSAYDLSLLFGVADAFQVAEKLFACINANYIQSKTFIVVHDIGELVFAQHAMIYEYAGKVVSYCLVEQNGCHTAVYASGESENDAVVAYLPAYFLNCCFYERCSAPVLSRAADVYHEVA